MFEDYGQTSACEVSFECAKSMPNTVICQNPDGFRTSGVPTPATRSTHTVRKQAALALRYDTPSLFGCYRALAESLEVRYIAVTMRVSCFHCFSFR